MKKFKTKTLNLHKISLIDLGLPTYTNVYIYYPVKSNLTLKVTILVILKLSNSHLKRALLSHLKSSKITQHLQLQWDTGLWLSY